MGRWTKIRFRLKVASYIAAILTPALALLSPPLAGIAAAIAASTFALAQDLPRDKWE